MTSADLAIDVRGLRKSYGSFEAVRGIDLGVSRREVFALLGPNGAGKTTTVEILEGYRERTAGQVTVLGYDPAKQERRFRERIGIVLQTTGIDPYLTVAETVDLFGGYFPNQRPTDEVLEVVGLTEQRDIRVRKLSGGQQRRLDVAVGLAGDPELLFLDEPTTGFDPGARRGAWEMIRNLQALGKTVLLTTHYMDEAEQLADRVAIMARGEIVALGTPEELRGRHTETNVRFRLPAEAPPLPSSVPASPPDAEGHRAVSTGDATRLLYELTRWAVDHHVQLLDVSVSRASLEDVYLEITGTRPTNEGETAS
jgi:ABC-2 type transport system ATP-binding protein